MALIDCPECKTNVSDAAKSCPDCGFPIQESLAQTHRPRATPQPAPLQKTGHKPSQNSPEQDRVLYEGAGRPPYALLVVDAFLCLFLIGLILLPYHYLQHQSQKYRIKSKKIEIEKGLISKTTEVLPLYRVRDIQLESSFGIDSIKLQSSDNSVPELKITFDEASQVFRELQPLIEGERKKANIRLTENV